MKTPLWTPSEERKRDANITRFMHDINARHGLNLKLLYGTLSLVD